MHPHLHQCLRNGGGRKGEKGGRKGENYIIRLSWTKVVHKNSFLFKKCITFGFKEIIVGLELPFLDLFRKVRHDSASIKIHYFHLLLLSPPSLLCLWFPSVALRRYQKPALGHGLQGGVEGWLLSFQFSVEACAAWAVD